MGGGNCLSKNTKECELLKNSLKFSTLVLSLSLAFSSTELNAAGLGTHGQDGTSVLEKGQDGANGSASQNDIEKIFDIKNNNQTIEINTNEQSKANGTDGQAGQVGNNGTNGQTTGYSGNQQINGFNGGKGSNGSHGGNGGNGSNLGDIKITGYIIKEKTNLSDKSYTLVLKGASGGNGGNETVVTEGMVLMPMQEITEIDQRKH
ncbi:hypothetical protein ACUMG2_001291, partial [Campylobacter lari]